MTPLPPLPASAMETLLGAEICSCKLLSFELKPCGTDQKVLSLTQISRRPSVSKNFSGIDGN
jgi:hypothetical protein